jgi:hypothetical protein
MCRGIPFNPCSVDVQDVSINSPCRVCICVDVQGVSLSSARCKDVQGVTTYTISSVDVQGVSFFAESSVDVQGVSV